MSSFESLGLSPALNHSLKEMNYETPTPIQAEAIPLALQGRDIMGSAQTGTGKTAAFAIPLVEHLLNNPSAMGVVMTPTRELGKQVMDVIHQLLGRKSDIKTAFIIGGEAMGKQFNKLRQNPRLIVGTPGRINDHLERGSLKLDKTSFLVLDETDRMLDMGFSVQIDRIVQYMPTERQTLLFSATMPGNIVKMSQKYQNNPERVAVGSTTMPTKNIRQEAIFIKHEEKFDELVRQLNERQGSVIIFVKTKYNTERLAKRLNGQGFKADAIHGDLKQSRRSRVIKSMRERKFRILVATDVVARGLDIPHIEHVINHDLPQVAEDYIHRIGRTARAGAEGEALCMISPQDRSKWGAIQRLIDPDYKAKPGEEREERKSRGRQRNRGGKMGAKRGGRGGFAGKPRHNDNYRDGEGRREGGEGRSHNGGKRSFGDKRREGGEGRSHNGGKRSFGDKRREGGEGRSHNGGKRSFGDKRREGEERSYNGDNRNSGTGDKRKKPTRNASFKNEDRVSAKDFKTGDFTKRKRPKKKNKTVKFAGLKNKKKRADKAA